jgi:Zn-dependent protease
LRWSYRLGKLAGIDVYVHLTFLLLLAWIGLSRLFSGQGVAGATLSILLMIMVFGIVVLHELGHALAARNYGIPTRDITLLPIGGVARLARMPELPLHEFIVAAAGPAVNLVLACLGALGLYVLAGLQASLPVMLAAEFIEWFVIANLVLLFFNLVPAFPMDGGRILRALLAFRLPYLKATEIAVKVARVLALGLGLYGLFGNPMLVLIAIFVWMGGGSELAMVRQRFQPAPAWGPVVPPFTGGRWMPGGPVLLVPGPSGWRVVQVTTPPASAQPPPPSVRIVDIR